MLGRLSELFPMILVTAFTSLVAAPLAIGLSLRARLVDVPDSAPHKQHAHVTPLAGGIVLTCAILVGYGLTLPDIDRQASGILVAAAVMVAWGIIDDRLGLKPYQKLLGQVLAASLVIYFGVQVRITRLPGLDLALTYLWLVGMTNAFNFVDSMDGLALGLAGIASAFFMLATTDSEQPILAILSAAVFGATVGAFLYNASPAKMFLGDSGAQFLGFVLAALGVAYVPARAGLPQGVSWFTPILVLGVPIFDMVLVVFSRLRRRKPIYRPGRDHTYHRLVALGLDPTRAVLAMQLASVLLGLTAFMALGASVVVANAIFGGIVVLGMVILTVFERAAVGGAGNGRTTQGA